MAQPAVTIFPDTNILLHYKPLREINWLAVAHAEAVKIVLCQQVIHELDKAKYDSRLHKRADAAQREIAAIRKAGGRVRQGVTLVISTVQVRREQIPGHLDPDHQDTQIIFCVKKYQEDHVGEDVMVVSGDLGMEQMCQTNAVGCISLDDALRLPVVQDEDRRKYRQAVEELAVLKNRLPSLCLVAKIITDHINPPTPDCLIELVPLPSLKVDVDEKMREIREMCPKQEYPKARHVLLREGTTPVNLANFDMNLPTRKEVDRYNREVEEFHRQSGAWLAAENREADALARSFCFEMWLENNGTKPATDVEVGVFFPPDFIRVLNTGEHLTPPAPRPKPPKPPMGKLQEALSLSQASMSHLSSMEQLFEGLGPAPNVSEPIFGFEEGMNLHIDLQKIKHHDSICLGAFRVAYRDWKAVKSFKARYRLHANELPKPSLGELIFRVNKGEQSSQNGL